MFLSDTTIAQLLASGQLKIVPEPEDRHMQPASVDMTLGTSWCRLPTHVDGAVNRYISEGVTLRPGEFILATTEQRVALPGNVAGVVKGKSSWARRGIMIESAGLVDPGFDGQITLEIKNLGPLPRLLRAGVAICQMVFVPMDRPVTRPYGTAGLGSHYQGQTGAEPSRG